MSTAIHTHIILFTFIHTYTHTYIHTYIHTTYIHTCTSILICTFCLNSLSLSLRQIIMFHTFRLCSNTSGALHEGAPMDILLPLENDLSPRRSRDRPKSASFARRGGNDSKMFVGLISLWTINKEKTSLSVSLTIPHVMNSYLWSSHADSSAHS